MHRRIALILASFLLLVGAPLATLAQSSVLPVKITEDVVYGHKMGMALSFDVLRPSRANGAGILYMVSGGWYSRHVDPALTAQQFQHALSEGFTVFAVRHGSAPLFKVPDAVEDVRQATRFIRANAADYGVDPERLGVFGGSAGGHLSLILGTTGEEGDPSSDDPLVRAGTKLAAVVAYFPPVDLVPITGPNDRFPALDFDPALAKAISPIYHVSADDPPSLMIHGDADELVPLANSERILKAFRETGVATDLIVIEGGAHGFRGDDATRATAALVQWFSDHLNPAPPVQATGN
jgi:acetyl esterase/lipase